MPGASPSAGRCDHRPRTKGSGCAVDRQSRARHRRMIARMSRDTAFRRASFDWITQGASYEYSYHFKWLGVPIIQLPADIVGLQEVIWKAKPELIVETRVARGGSMIFYASLLELIGGTGARSARRTLEGSTATSDVPGGELSRAAARASCHPRFQPHAHARRERARSLRGGERAATSSSSTRSSSTCRPAASPSAGDRGDNPMTECSCGAIGAIPTGT